MSYLSILCRHGVSEHSFLRIHVRGPDLIVPRTLIILCLPRPHPQFLPLRYRFCLSVFLFQVPKLGTRFGFINSCQPCLQHLIPNIFPEEEPPYPYCGYHPLILIPLVDIRPYAAVCDVVCQPGEGFVGVWLCRLAEMCSFRRVDSRQADVYLCPKSAPLECAVMVKQVNTVFPFNSAFFWGNFRNHPQPASLPPGV